MAPPQAGPRIAARPPAARARGAHVRDRGALAVGAPCLAVYRVADPLTDRPPFGIEGLLILVAATDPHVLGGVAEAGTAVLRVALLPALERKVVAVAAGPPRAVGRALAAGRVRLDREAAVTTQDNPLPDRDEAPRLRVAARARPAAADGRGPFYRRFAGRPVR